jgi:hypothetical protein
LIVNGGSSKVNSNSSSLIDTLKAQTPAQQNLASVMNQKKMGDVIPTTPKEQFGSEKAPYHLRHVKWDDGKSTDPSGYYQTINVDGKEMEIEDWATAASLAHHRDEKLDWAKGGHPKDRYYSHGDDIFKVTHDQKGHPIPGTVVPAKDYDELQVTHKGKKFRAIENMKGKLKGRGGIKSDDWAIYDKWATSAQNNLGENQVMYYGYARDEPGWFKRDLSKPGADDEWRWAGKADKINTRDPSSRFTDLNGVPSGGIGYSARRRRRK